MGKAASSTRVTSAELRKIARKGEKPRADLPAYVDVPQEPINTPEEDRALYAEQQVLRVETMMMKGIRDKFQLMKLLHIPNQAQLERYMARVKARWAMGGSTQEHATHRGEALHRLDLTEREMWIALQRGPGDAPLPVTEKMSILRGILDVHDRRTELLGLTPKVIERIGIDSGADLTFSKEAAAHQRMKMMAARMLEIIEEKYGPRSQLVIEDGTSSPDA